MTELESCPRCGALPCDWTDNPHHPQPTGDVGALVERLTETEPRFSQLTGKELYAIYPNRDGPEAAATIVGLTAEVERKDAALRPFAEAWDERDYLAEAHWSYFKNARQAIGKAET